MRWYRPILLLPASCFLIVIEIFLALSLALWIIGWPVASRLQSFTNNDGLWDDNSVSIYFYVIVTVMTLMLMLCLLGSIFPFCGGFIARWMTVAAITFGLVNLVLVAQTSYLTVRFIGIGNCDNTIHPGYCHGSKIIFAASLCLTVFTVSVFFYTFVKTHANVSF
eukprot:TRINITY_DN677_c0_g1_i1.p1 TRINITY_DN677_c0_g1~~TRINITY_DN677_c0_g1_i1.p1  ORF type:complete len:165 (-),score=7.12 TRINITY_DN677_c0_g1_i1:35-529(-)